MAEHTPDVSLLGELTRTKSSGKPTNVHVVEHKKTIAVDYERMRELVHNVAASSMRSNQK